MIRIAEAKDAALIAIIYNNYIANSTVTFEEEAVDSQMILKRMNANKQLKWWVCENEIVGYAYAAYWKSRSAYRYTLETSVYIASDHQKKGIGKKIYSILVEELKTLGFKTLLAGISLPNRGVSFFTKT